MTEYQSTALTIAIKAVLCCFSTLSITVMTSSAYAASITKTMSNASQVEGKQNSSTQFDAMPQPPDAESHLSQLPTISVQATAARQQVQSAKNIEDLKDVVHSISVMSQDRIQQQGLHSLDSVLLNTTGVTREQTWLKNSYSSRGLSISNVRYDGGASSDLQDRDSEADPAQFEYIAVLRGVDALFGATDAGGVIDLRHKRPQSTPAIESTVSLGSWNNYRFSLDATAPLNRFIQGRTVAVLQDRDFFHRPTHSQRQMLYGALNFDLGPSTRLFTGASMQRDKTKAFNTGVLRWDDGSDIGFSRRTTMVAPWGWLDRENISIFANIEQELNDVWKSQLKLRYSTGDDSGNAAALENAINSQNHKALRVAYQDKRDLKEFNFDLNLQGGFDLWGQQHQLILGVDSKYLSTDFKRNWIEKGLVDVFDISVPVADHYPPRAWQTNLSNQQRRTAMYATLDFKALEQLTLSVGGRYTLQDRVSIENHNQKVLNRYKQDQSLKPYYVIRYALLPNTSLYFSYADLYKSQAQYLTALNGTSLIPIEGTQMEFGLKTELSPRLLASVAYYQIKKRNEAVLLERRKPNSNNSVCCYVAAGDKRSEGIDLELNGLINDHWNISMGYTYNENQDRRKNDLKFRNQTPRHLLKIWSDYQLSQVLSGLSFGGGVTAQSATAQRGLEPIYNPITQEYGKPTVPYRITQGGYATWSVRAAYQLTPNLDLALNLNNLFDKKYYSTIGFPSYGNYYGEPRNVLFTLTARH